MRLTWNEVRARAATIAEDWKDATSEKNKTQSFCNDFYEIFGKRRCDVSRYEQHVSKLYSSSGFIDLLRQRAVRTASGAAVAAWLCFGNSKRSSAN